MAMGDFTKEQAVVAQECIDLIFKAVPKTKQMDLLGELNELSLFVSAAKRNAPGEEEVKK